jgi:hypothetical protein
MEKKKKMSKTVEIKNTEDLRALVKRIDKDNPKSEDLEALSKEMDEMPELFFDIGNAQKNVFERVLESGVTTRFARECALRYIEEMKTQMGYQTSTFVEKMLIDEIVMRYIRLQMAEASYQSHVIDKSHSLEIGTYHEKIVEQAQKRYIRAIETLVKVRKMIAQTQAKGAEMFKSLLKKDN